MFSGIQEILLILLILAAVFFLPRLLGRRAPSVPARQAKGNPLQRLSGSMRAAVLGSILWLLVAAFYFEPWKRELSTYVLVGFGPVVLLWGMFWIAAGFRKNR